MMHGLQIDSLSVGGRQNEDNRRAIPVSPLPKSVVDALAFDMIRGDSDSNKFVNSTI